MPEELVHNRDSGNKTSLRKHLFPLFFLILGIALIYSNSLDGGFQFDDGQITERPNLHVTELNIQSLKGTLYFVPRSKQIYRPLPCLTLGLNYYFGKENPFGYHLVNISIHILCAIAVYFFLQTLLSIPRIKPVFAQKYKHEIAVIATFLFAFHPIQTNVATYIIQRMTSMAALFYIVSVTGYIGFRLQTLPEGRNSTLRRYLNLSIAIIGGLFSILSKENAVFLPIIVLLTEYLFFYPLSDENEKRKLRRIYALSFFFLFAVFSYAGIKPLLSYVNGYGHRDFSLIERLLTEPRIVFFYLYLLFIPNISLLNLNHDILISKGILNPPQTLFAMLGIALLLIVAFITRKRQNLLSFLILWYLGNLVIESTIIPLELIYEHRTYLPGVLIFFLMSLGIVYASKNLLQRAKFILLTSLLLILYGNGTYLRNFVFRTPISLWSDVVEKSPNSARAHANLGKYYIDYGYFQEGKEETEKALEIDPFMAQPLINLGKLYLDRFGMKDEAIVLFKRAQKHTPKEVIGCMGLGDAYLKLKDFKKAEHYYRAAVRRLSFYTPAINNLAITKIHLGKIDEAIKVLKYGIKVDPLKEDFHLNLAKLYSNERRFSDAILTLDNYLLKNKHSRRAKALLEATKQKAASSENQTLATKMKH